MNTPIHPEFTGNTEGFASFKWPPSCLKELANFRLLVTSAGHATAKVVTSQGQGRSKLRTKMNLTPVSRILILFFFFLISFNSFRIFYFPRKQFQFLFRFYSILHSAFYLYCIQHIFPCIVCSIQRFVDSLLLLLTSFLRSF